ncbi:MAG: hypothetical protein K8S55_01260 [Phycisphaerae bacterium]|nr:hypothetical protein [Phycisphaerae bacterium]
MALIINIADAVTAELNAADPGTFSRDFIALRKVLPAYELSELAELKITVVPKTIEINGSTRSVCQYDFAIDIGIQQKLPSGCDMETEVETMGTLVDEIADYLRRRPLAASPWAVWVNTKNDPPYAPEHLAEQRVFTSVLTVTYRAMK